MMRGKKGDTAFIILAIILVVAGIIGIILKTTIKSDDEKQSEWYASKTVAKSNETSIGNKGKDLDENKINSGNISIIESTGGGGGGGGSGGESSSQSTTPVLAPVCTKTRSASYAILTINQSQNCKEYDGEICVNKDVVCLAKLRSDDALISKYEIELLFVENKKSKDEYFDILSSSYTLAPKQNVILSGQTNIQSEGEEGLANQVINCFFNTVGEPVACLN